MHVGDTADDIRAFGVEFPAVHLNGLVQGSVEGVSGLVLFTAEPVDHAYSDGRAGRDFQRALRQPGQRLDRQQQKRNHGGRDWETFAIHILIHLIEVFGRPG